MPHPPQIPLTPQTDERNFPRWDAKAPPGKSGHPYPKMLTKICTREDREAWVNKNRRVDRVTREDYWEDTPPRIGAPIPILVTQDLVDAGLCPLANEPLVVNDQQEETEIRAFLGLTELQPPAAQKVRIPIAAPPEKDDEPPKAVKAAPRKPGRPKKVQPVEVDEL